MITDDFQKVLSRVWYTWQHIATHGPQCLRTNQIGLNCLSVLCSQHTVQCLTAWISQALTASESRLQLLISSLGAGVSGRIIPHTITIPAKALVISHGCVVYYYTPLFISFIFLCEWRHKVNCELQKLKGVLKALLSIQLDIHSIQHYIFLKWILS